MKRTIRIAGVFLTLLLIMGSMEAVADDTQVMALVDGGYGGIPKEMFNKIRDEMIAGLQKKTGKQFDVKIFPTIEAVREAAKKGEINFVMAGVDYPIANSLGAPLLPLATLEIKGKYMFSDCFWVADSSTYKTMSDLKGKVLVMNVYPTLWGIFVNEGITESPMKFFSKIYNYKDSAIALKSVLSGTTDAILMGESYLAFHEFDDSLKGKFRSVACSEPVVATNLMYHKDTPPELLEQIRLIVTNIHRDPDFTSLRFMFLSTGGTMRIVTADDFANSVEMYDKALKLGWGDELKSMENAPLLEDNM